MVLNIYILITVMIVLVREMLKQVILRTVSELIRIIYVMKKKLPLMRLLDMKKNISVDIWSLSLIFLGISGLKPMMKTILANQFIEPLQRT